MNRRHRVALRHHCRLACETVHPMFGRLHGGGFTSIVTVNSGYE